MKVLVKKISFKDKDINKLYRIFASHHALCGIFSANEECQEEDKWCKEFMMRLEEKSLQK